MNKMSVPDDDMNTIFLEVDPDLLLGGTVDLDAFFGCKTYLEFSINPQDCSAEDSSRLLINDEKLEVATNDTSNSEKNEVFETNNSDEDSNEEFYTKSEGSSNEDDSGPSIDEEELEEATISSTNDEKHDVLDINGIKEDGNELSTNYVASESNDFIDWDTGIADGEVSNIKGNIDNISTMQDQFQNEDKSRQIKEFFCDLCGKMFDGKESLSSHITNAQDCTGNGMASNCIMCDETFITKKELTKHNQTKHDIDWVSCDLCEKRFSKRDTLITHKNSVHSDNWHYCSYCDYKANRVGNLAVHIKSKHQGLQYFCDKCDFKSSQQSNLTIHIEIKHK